MPSMLLDRMPQRRSNAGEPQEEEEDGTDPIPVSVWTSTLKRTIQTANYLPFPKLRCAAAAHDEFSCCWLVMCLHKVPARYNSFVKCWLGTTPT